MNNLENNDFEFKTFRIPNKFIISPKGRKTKELSVLSPKRCPICGNEEVIEKLKLESINHKKFVSIFMCEDHYKPYLSSVFKYICYPCFYIIPIIILAFILYELTSTILIFGLGGIIAFAIFSYKLYHREKNMNLLQKNIELRYSKKYSIISIKRDEWAEEFRRLNQFKEDLDQIEDIKVDLELIKHMKTNYQKNRMIFEITFPVVIAGMIILVILQQEYIVLIMIILIIILGFFLAGNEIYYNYKIDKLNASFYWKSLKKKDL